MEIENGLILILPLIQKSGSVHSSLLSDTTTIVEPRFSPWSMPSAACSSFTFLVLTLSRRTDRTSLRSTF